MPHYLVNVAGKEFDIELQYRSEKYYAKLNGKEIEINGFRLGESRSILIIDGKALEVDVRSNGYDYKKTVFMKGQEIEVAIEDYNLAQLRKTAGFSSKKTIEKIVRAPMPGMILEVKVSQGNKVKKNQPLLIVEAMKMENIIRAQGEGTIKEVLVKSNALVEKGDKLIEFE